MDGILALMAEGDALPAVPIVIVGQRPELADSRRTVQFPVVAWHKPPIRTTALINSVQAAARQFAPVGAAG